MDITDQYIHQYLLPGRDKQDRFLEVVRGFAWHFDYPDDRLVFTRKSGWLGKDKLVAKVQLLGTYATEFENWFWAWANPQNIPENLLVSVKNLHTLGREQSSELLTITTLTMDNNFVHVLAAIAVELCGAIGYFEVPRTGSSMWLLVYADFVPNIDDPIISSWRLTKF